MLERTAGRLKSQCLVLISGGLEDRGCGSGDGQQLGQCPVLENSRLASGTVNAQTVVGGGNLQWTNGLDVGSVERAIQPGNIRVLEPVTTCQPNNISAWSRAMVGWNGWGRGWGSGMSGCVGGAAESGGGNSSAHVFRAPLII